MQENYGMKEIYDVSLRLNSAARINNKEFLPNETLLHFETAEIVQIRENKIDTQARGGYHNPPLINWEVDKDVRFNITNGVLSPISLALLSNSSIITTNKKSVSFNEALSVIEDEQRRFYVDLKYCPNHTNEKLGLQGNPNNEPLPMGRREDLELKPLPPSKDKFIFCYDYYSGERIDNFLIKKNRIYLPKDYRKIYVDYTFNCMNSIKTLNVGERLFNNFLSLTAKTNVKDDKTGRVTTVVLEIPKLKIDSSLSLNLGKNYGDAAVSDFYFTGYPEENVMREKQSVCKISFLEDELTGDYI